MKTAVSIPDPVFAAAERVAKRLRMSRSQLYATALAEFVASHEEEEVTVALDRVYDTQASALDPALRDLQALSLPREEW